MAKLTKPLKFRAILFADGPRGSYFQEWQCEKYPSLFVRVHGARRGESVKQIFVKKRNLNVVSFKTLEKAVPFAREHNWNPYAKSSTRTPVRSKQGHRK